MRVPYMIAWFCPCNFWSWNEGSIYKTVWFCPEDQYDELLAFRKNTMWHIPADDQSGPLGYRDLHTTVVDIHNGKQMVREEMEASSCDFLPLAAATYSSKYSFCLIFRSLFLVTQADGIKCSVCKLPPRLSAAVDETHQTMTTTWESHWNAESQRTCDCMLSGRRILNSCKCVVSTPGHVLRNWKSHTCSLRLYLFSFHPVPHLREAVEAGLNHLGLSLRSWASQLSISHR